MVDLVVLVVFVAQVNRGVLVNSSARNVGLVVRLGCSLLVKSSSHSVGLVVRLGCGLLVKSSAHNVVVSLWELGCAVGLQVVSQGYRA